MRSYHLTAQDTEVLTSAVGRVRSSVLVVPPGRRRYKLTADADVLVRVENYTKKTHVVDAITRAEDITHHLQAAHRRAAYLAQMDARDDRARYILAASLTLLGEYGASYGGWRALADAATDSLVRAGATAHVARAHWRRREYEQALAAATKAHDLLDAIPTDTLTGTLLTHTLAVKSDALRALGRHDEAAAVYGDGSYNLAISLERADALAWALDSRTIGAYDDIIARYPYDAAPRARRWRFWWDETGWQSMRPTVNPSGRTHRALDRLPESLGTQTAAFRRMALDVPYSLNSENARAEIVCDSFADRPWILELRTPDGTWPVPVLQPRERLSVPLPREGAVVTARAPDDIGPVRLLVRGGGAVAMEPAWVERQYVPIPDTRSVAYEFDVPGSTYVRILARGAGSGETSLEAVLDGRERTPIHAVHTSETPEPAECLIPVAAGHHRLSISRSGDARQALWLAVAIRAVQLRQTEAAPAEIATGARAADIAAERAPATSISAPPADPRDALTQPSHSSSGQARSDVPTDNARPTVDDLMEQAAKGPLSAAAGTLLGRALREAGATDQAVAQLRAVLDARPIHPRARYELAVTKFVRGQLREALDQAAIYLRSDHADGTLRVQARYVMANCSAALGEIAAARDAYTLLQDEASGDAPELIAMKRQAIWELRRLDARERLESPAASAEEYAHLADFNRAWSEAPHVRWRASVRSKLDVFDLDWERISGSQTTAVSSLRIAYDIGGSAGPPYLRIADGDTATVGVTGPTLLRVELRGIVPTEDSASDRIAADVAVSVNGVERDLWTVRTGDTAPSIVFPDYPDLRPGRRRVRYVEIPSGSHTVRLDARSGAAAGRLYALRPGPEAWFAGSDRNATRSREVRDRVWRYDALTSIMADRRADPLLALRAEVALNSEPPADVAAAAAGVAPGAASYLMATWLTNNAGRSMAIGAASTAVDSLHPASDLLPAAILLLARCQDGADAIATYRRYLSLRADDGVAGRELASIYQALGDGATGQSDRTGLYCQALNEFERLSLSHPELRGVEEGRLAALRATEWQSIYAVENAAGTMLVELARHEEGVVPPWGGYGWLLVAPGEGVRYAFALSDQASLRVETASEDGAPGAVEWVLNESSSGVVEAAGSDVKHAEVQTVGSGKHVLSIRARKDVSSRQWVRVLADRDVHSTADPTEDGWWPTLPVTRVTMQVADAATPATVHVQGPTRLRVTTRLLGTADSLDGPIHATVTHGGVVVARRDISLIPTYSDQDARLVVLPRGSAPVSHAVETTIPVPVAGLCRVEIGPQRRGASARILVRLHARVAKAAISAQTGLPPSPLSWRRPVANATPRGAGFATLGETSWPEPWSLGTFESQFGYGQRIQSGIDEDDYPRYAEVTGRHRIRVGRSVYQRAGLAVRKGRGLPPVFSAEESLDVPLPGRARLLARADIDIQSAGGAARHAARASLETRRSHTIAPTLRHVTRLRLSARTFSLDKDERRAVPGLATDVFSLYGLRHDRQFGVESLLWFEPLLDVVLYSRTRLRTNRGLGPLDPDYAYARVGVRKLWRQGIDAHAYYQIRRWFEDEHRREASFENRVYLRLQSAAWRGASHVTARAIAVYTVGNREWLFLSGLTFALPSGRGLGDYAPGAIDFRRFKARRRSPMAGP